MSKLIASSFLVVATCVTSFAADGEVVKVFASRPPKEAVEARMGDLLIVSFQGGTYPGGMISGLKVEIKGDCLTKVGVYNVPQINEEGERAVGGIDMSAFLKTAKEGEAIVTITPLGDLGPEKSKSLKFIVTVLKPDPPQ